MFNFGLLASTTPYIVMAFLCAMSYVWMLFDKKPADQIEYISDQQQLNFDIEHTNKNKATTYVVANDEFKTSPCKYETVDCINTKTNNIVCLSFLTAKLYSKTYLTQLSSFYQHFYFSRPPPFSC